MMHRFLLSIAAAALIAGSGLVHAQAINGNSTDGAASGPGSAATPHPVTGDAPIRGGFAATPATGSSGARVESDRLTIGSSSRGTNGANHSTTPSAPR